MRETRALRVVLLCSALLTSGAAAQKAPVRNSPAPAATSTPAAAPLPIVVAIRDLTPREHRVQAFLLAAPGSVQVEAVGAEPRPPRNDGSSPWPAKAWILDARTRQVVWDLSAATTPASTNGVRRFTGAVALPAGTYELHYASYPATSVTTGGGAVLENLKTIITNTRRDNTVRYSGPYINDGLYRQFGVTLRGAGRVAGFAELAAARKLDASVVGAVHPVRHEAIERTAFALSQPVTLDLLAVGELSENRSADIGWIIDADSRREIWRMSFARSERNGGATRSRSERAALQLPAGRYVAYFITNSSYDPSEWNQMPPLDPDSWGLTLRIANPAQRAAFKAIDWQPIPATGTLASITKVGDDQTRTADFTLTQPTNVQLYALGEASGDELSDYAWLVDSDRHQRVWTMKKSETTSAGGASKNREFNGVLRLPAGHYRLNYVSDDSHSYDGWNADAPYEPDGWGVSAWPAGGKVAPDAVMPVISTANLKPLAAIRHAGDNLSVQVGFRMESDGKLRVHAIGEGSDGGMQDYATIEDARTHRQVWSMRYAQTEPAGGGDKNRQFDGVIDLKAGRYILRWRSDDSHSWGRWNVNAPDEPEGWGVVISRVPAGATP